MSAAVPPVVPVAVRPSLGGLTRTFLLVGATSFGGGLTGYLRRALVEERCWLTEEEFLHGLSVAQAVPGPNAVNLAVFVGYRMHGLVGSALAVGSVFLVPLVALSLLAAGWTRWGTAPPVTGALKTLAAFGAGLMGATGAWIFRSARMSGSDLILTAVSFAAVGVLHLPVPAVLAVLLFLSVWIHRKDSDPETEDGA